MSQDPHAGQDPPRPPADDDATRMVSPADADATRKFSPADMPPPAPGSGPQPGPPPPSGQQPDPASGYGAPAGPAPGYDPQPGSAPRYRAQPRSTPGYSAPADPAPGYGAQPGSAPGYGAQPGSTPGYSAPADSTPGYGAQPGSTPGYGPQPPSYGEQIPYGQLPGSAPQYYQQPPTGYGPPGHDRQGPYGAPGGHPGGYGRPGYPPPPPGYGYAQPPGQPYVPGRFGPRPGTDDNSMAMLSHLLGLLVSWIGPLIIYLVRKDQSPYVRDHAAGALNFELTMFIGYLASMFLMFFFIGFLTLPAIYVVSLIFHIQAAVAANKGKHYRYPIAIPFIT